MLSSEQPPLVVDEPDEATPELVPTLPLAVDAPDEADPELTLPLVPEPDAEPDVTVPPVVDEPDEAVPEPEPHELHVTGHADKKPS